VTKRPRSIYSNYGLVLARLAENPRRTLRELGQSLDLTDRAVYEIIRDLAADGLIEKKRDGRNNVYRVRAFPSPNVHMGERDRTLKLLTSEGDPMPFFTSRAMAGQVK